MRTLFHTLALTLISASLVGAFASLMGEEQFGNQPVPPNDEWPAGTLAVANNKARVYRQWVNGNENFCFVGDTKTLNAALVEFAAIGGETCDVLLIPSQAEMLTLEGKSVRYDWRMNAPSGIYKGMMDRDRSIDPIFTTRPVLFVHTASERIDAADIVVPKSVNLLGPAEIIARARKSLTNKPTSEEASHASQAAARQLAWFAHDEKVRETLLTLFAHDEHVTRVTAISAVIDSFDPPQDMHEQITKLHAACEDKNGWKAVRLSELLEALAAKKPGDANADKALLARDKSLRKLVDETRQR